MVKLYTISISSRTEGSTWKVVLFTLFYQYFWFYQALLRLLLQVVKVEMRWGGLSSDFLFAPIALPIALVASPIRENMSSFKACSSCMEQIHINATRCPFCTSAVKERETKSEITTETVTVNRDQIGKDKQRLFDTAESLGFKVDSHPGSSRFTFIKDGKSFDFFDVDKAKDFLVASKK